MRPWDELAEDEQDEALANALSKAFNIPQMLAREVMWMNDEAAYFVENETPETRWERRRECVRPVRHEAALGCCCGSRFPLLLGC